MYEADEGFVTVDGARLCHVDCRSVVQRLLDLDEEYRYPATLMDGYFHIIREFRKYVGPRSSSGDASDETQWRTYRYLDRPECPYEDGDGSLRTPNTTSAAMSGDILSMRRTDNTISVNTLQFAYLHDKRFDKPCRIQTFEAGTEIMTVSDRFIGVNLGDEFLFYRRDSITERTLLQRYDGRVDCADHTSSETAFSRNGTVMLSDIDDGAVRIVRNRAGAGQSLVGLFYIRGELYIVRERAIYKHIA